jgi:integrase
MRGLQVDDLDLPGRTLMIERQVHEGGLVTGPKGRKGKRKVRAVDLADELATVLELFLLARRAYDLRFVRRSPWLLYPDFSDQPTSAQVSTVTHRLRRSMARVLVQAKLADHFTPHCLRHTFARLLLERGEDLLYVGRQLGDTLAITAEIYGKWARVPARAGGTNLLSEARPVRV